MKLPPTHKPLDTVRESAPQKRFGERLMHTMGWEKGQGLGKEGTGIKSAIRAKKKEGLEGVGSKKGNAWDWSDDWWEKSFNQAAGSLQEIRAQGSPDSSASADTAQLDTPQPAAAAAAAPEPAAAAPQRPSAATTGLDRWGGFRSRAGKLARVMRQEALIGTPASAAAGAEDPAEAGPKRKKRKQDKAAAPAEQRKAPRVIEVVTQEPEPEAYVLPARPANWWGNSRFVSSGCMGSMREKEAAKDKPGFTEDDQANLHEHLSALKGAGKSGLGTGQAARLGTDSLKVKADERWAGNKKSFGDDDEDDNEPLPEGPGSQPDAAPAQPAVKWRKLCSTILAEQAGQKLKLKKLEKLFLSKLSSLHGPDTARQWQQAGLLLPKVLGSSKFQVEDKIVSIR